MMNLLLLSSIFLLSHCLCFDLKSIEIVINELECTLLTDVLTNEELEQVFENGIQVFQTSSQYSGKVCLLEKGDRISERFVNVDAKVILTKSSGIGQVLHYGKFDVKTVIIEQSSGKQKLY